MRSSDANSAPASSRAARSKLALAIVAVLLLATLAPVSGFRGRMPRWSSPTNSLGNWLECRGDLSQLRADYFFNGPKAKAIEAILFADGTVEPAVTAFPDEDAWQRTSSQQRKSGATPASRQFDDLFYYPTVPTGGPAAEPVQAARSNPPIAD
jgi:hypothetical protein